MVDLNLDDYSALYGFVPSSAFSISAAASIIATVEVIAGETVSLGAVGGLGASLASSLVLPEIALLTIASIGAGGGATLLNYLGNNPSTTTKPEPNLNQQNSTDSRSSNLTSPLLFENGQSQQEGQFKQEDRKEETRHHGSENTVPSLISIVPPTLLAIIAVLYLRSRAKKKIEDHVTTDEGIADRILANFSNQANDIASNLDIIARNDDFLHGLHDFFEQINNRELFRPNESDDLFIRLAKITENYQPDLETGENPLVEVAKNHREEIVNSLGQIRQKLKQIDNQARQGFATNPLRTNSLRTNVKNGQRTFRTVAEQILNPENRSKENPPLRTRAKKPSTIAEGVEEQKDADKINQAIPEKNRSNFVRTNVDPKIVSTNTAATQTEELKKTIRTQNPTVAIKENFDSKSVRTADFQDAQEGHELFFGGNLAKGLLEISTSISSVYAEEGSSRDDTDTLFSLGDLSFEVIPSRKRRRANSGLLDTEELQKSSDSHGAVDDLKSRGLFRVDEEENNGSSSPELSTNQELQESSDLFSANYPKKGLHEVTREEKDKPKSKGLNKSSSADSAASLLVDLSKIYSDDSTIEEPKFRFNKALNHFEILAKENNEPIFPDNFVNSKKTDSVNLKQTKSTIHVTGKRTVADMDGLKMKNNINKNNPLERKQSSKVGNPQTDQPRLDSQISKDLKKVTKEPSLLKRSSSFPSQSKKPDEINGRERSRSDSQMEVQLKKVTEEPSSKPSSDDIESYQSKRSYHDDAVSIILDNSCDEQPETSMVLNPEGSKVDGRGRSQSYPQTERKEPAPRVCEAEGLQLDSRKGKNGKGGSDRG